MAIGQNTGLLLMLPLDRSKNFPLGQRPRKGVIVNQTSILAQPIRTKPHGFVRRRRPLGFFTGASGLFVTGVVRRVGHLKRQASHAPASAQGLAGGSWFQFEEII